MPSTSKAPKSCQPFGSLSLFKWLELRTFSITLSCLSIGNYATLCVIKTQPPVKFCRKLLFSSRIFLIFVSILHLPFKTERAGIFSDPLVKFVKLITSHSLLFFIILYFHIRKSSSEELVFFRYQITESSVISSPQSSSSYCK